MKRFAAGLALLSLTPACGGAAGGASPLRQADFQYRLASPAAFREARRQLGDYRAAETTGAVGWNVEARFSDERSNRRQSGRGALAVRPPDALRLQLVGPAGKLALDVWMGPTGARLASPALGFVERTALGEHRPGRPTGFLAWWLLRRWEGRLLAVADDDVTGRPVWLLRASDGALVTLAFVEGGVEATRRTSDDVELVHHRGQRCGVTTYHSDRAGLTVALVCTGETAPPKDKAFDDPDGTPR